MNMTPDISQIDYSALDRPEILYSLFHPRPESGAGPETKEGVNDILIPVEDDVVIGARFHAAGKTALNILYFHGNGEIVSDYDELAPLYTRLGINFMPVDYRGYGRSTGKPTITSMMQDCHIILGFFIKWLDENSYTGPIVLMGRSLGSASVLELAVKYKDLVQGLIVESGFAWTAPLLRLLGVDIETLGIKEEATFENIQKIAKFDKPTLIIHAENDHLIPLAHGEALYEACGSSQKTFLKIQGANHNDIFLRGLSEYMEAVRKLSESVQGP